MKTIATIALCLNCLRLCAAEPILEKTEVFPTGMNGVTLYRIPGIAVTKKGTVLAYCEARKDSKSDWGEIEVHLRRSTDGGKTWEESKQIAHLADRIEGNPRKPTGGEREQTVNNPVAIVDRDTGNIELLYCVNYARCFSMQSADDGLTWSTPTEITASFEPFRSKYPWKVIATGPGHGIQLKSGRLVVPIWLAYGNTGDHAPSASATIYSDDHGKSWLAGEIAVPDEGEFGDPNETMITELSDGRVMLVTRSVSKPNRKLITISRDGATGWSKPKFHDQLWEPICMASIVSHPSQGGMLIFSNPHSLGREKDGNETPAGRGKRQNLSIKLSRDDGKTWPISKTLESGPSAYSDLAVLPDGRILCLYEGDNTMICARFNLDWLDSEPKPPKGFRALFNGNDLSGWYGWNPHESEKLTGEKKEANLNRQRADFANHWKAEGGELVNVGKGPYATTVEEFGDIELMVEYKTVAGADSGIYLRGTPQVQIWDKNQKFDPKNPNRKPHQGSGGLFNNSPNTLGRDPIALVDKPFGQWNSLKIRQIGARTWVTLNTRLVVEGAAMENFWDRSRPLAAKGPIMLQTHGGEIRWRNIFVREIGEREAKETLAKEPELPNPTYYDVAYGPHPKQLLHFWRAESEQPTPVLLFIHGGGWNAGGRLSGLSAMLPKMLSEGVSVASVEYRFIAEATADGVTPPVKGPLLDAARALQLVRSKSTEWNIDKNRIAASGGSAGACTALWLAFHPDLADERSEDPIARQSTRLLCAAVTGAQTTLDPKQMKDWTPNSRYGGHAFGFTGDAKLQFSQFDEFLAKRDTILPWIAEYSPYALVSSDDPPVYLFYATPPALGQDQKDPTHTSNFGVKLQEHCRDAGVACELYYPNAADAKHTSVQEYLLEKLRTPK